MSEIKKIHEKSDDMRVTWDEITSQEQERLLRVETQLLAYHDQAQHERTEHVQLFAKQRAFRWLTPSLATLACMLFIALWWTADSPLPELELQGTLQVSSTVSKSHEKRSTIQLQAQASIQDPQGWSVHSEASSALKIKRSNKKAHIRLQRGAIQVHVRPHSMKTFVVVCHKHFKVVVKGTRFLVWQNRSALRVEVTRGHVVIQRGKQERLHLYQGQGVHVRFTNEHVLKTYTIPKETKKHSDDNWIQKVEFLARKHPKQLFPYVQDVYRDTLLSLSVRGSLLETAAHALEGLRQWEKASQIWRQLYHLHRKYGLDAQTALFQSAQSCRRSKAPRARCVRIFRLYRKRFPKGLPLLKASSLFWHGRLLFEQAHSKVQGRILLKRYSQLYPRGMYIHQVHALLNR